MIERRRNPAHLHEYQTQHGTTVYYLRKPGCPKVRLRIPEGCLPWSPAFMAIYEAAMSEAPAKPELGASRTVPGTVNAALIKTGGFRTWTEDEIEQYKRRFRVPIIGR